MSVVNGQRLLLIDDEPLFCHFARQVAEREGYAVKVTTRAAEFKRAVREFQPTVIMMDMVMPDAEGIELLQYLASLNCRARILVISGYNPDYPRLAKAIAGSHGLTTVQALTKPIGAKDLRAALAGNAI
jgi:CheY-like chemotaxis protein